MSVTPCSVLFVCVENSARSQMAEAFARLHGGASVEAFSAGSWPSGRVNPQAVAAMAERGYDLTTHASKSLQHPSLQGRRFDAVITMGCGDACPWVPAARRQDWALPDPKGLDAAGVRSVRDAIEARVKQLLAELSVASDAGSGAATAAGPDAAAARQRQDGDAAGRDSLPPIRLE